MKRNSLSHVIRKMQIKTMKYHSTLGMIKIHWQHQMLVRLGSNRNSRWLLMETQSAIDTLEGSLALSTKLSISLAIQSNNCAPWYLPKGAETLWLQKNIYTDVYSSFIINYENLEATTIFFSTQMENKQWFIQTKEYCLGLKRNELSSHERILRKLNAYY